MPDDATTRAQPGFLAQLVRQVIVPNAQLRPRTRYPAEIPSRHSGTPDAWPAVVDEPSPTESVESPRRDRLDAVLRVASPDRVRPRGEEVSATPVPARSVAPATRLADSTRNDESETDRTRERQAQRDDAPARAEPIARSVSTVVPTIGPAAARRAEDGRPEGLIRSTMAEVQRAREASDAPRVDSARGRTGRLRESRAAVNETESHVGEHIASPRGAVRPSHTRLADPDHTGARVVELVPIAAAATPVPRSSEAAIAPAVVPTPNAATPREEAWSPGERLGPSVHVTIGRVEIRAVTPPLAGSPTRRAAVTNPPMSLTDYLKGRTGGGR